MEQFKDAYEISLWEDVPVAASSSGNNKIPAHYEEEKIGVIGSDSMTAQWRAVEPRLTQNVNGTNTFSFKMFYTYIDTITGERKDNPFQNLLVNERKVKVKWKDKWYDFVIKNRQEDSSGKSVTYTCQDQFINELSKNGFNLEFDNELGNNMGTAKELAETVLDGTDWSVGEGKPIKQYREEPVYDISDTWIDEQQVRHNIRFLVFYSVVQNHATDFQYWYDSSNQYTRDGTSMLVVNGECKSATASWNEDTATVTIEGHSMDIDFAPLNVSDNYRAKRLVKSQETAFCPPLDRYVLKYKKDGDTYYGYETTSYTDPTLVTDYIVNGRAFTSTQGWTGADWNVYPSYSTGAENVTSYLIIPKGSWVQNSTLYDYRYGRFKNGLTKGEKLVLRIKAKYGNNTMPTGNSEGGLTIQVSLPDGSGTNYISHPVVPVIEKDKNGEKTGWTYYVLTCDYSCPYDELTGNTPVTLRFKYDTDEGSITCLWIEEIQLFDYTVNSSGKLLIPSEYDVDGVVKTEWRYFAEQYLTVPSEEDVIFSDYSDTPNLNYIPDYPEGDKVGEKIRSITGKNSNRFNWIQTIAETFECWAKFYIEHNTETGELKYYNGVPHKEVTFVEEIGDNTGLSFVYGIDLNTISRTINSDQIATKVIVSPNSNEFAEDGFCTIARSSENYSKANFILDFGYYINQGMLSSGEINRDLYDSSDSDNGIGYYYWLRQFNTRYDQITDKIVDLKAQLDRYSAALDNYTKLCDSTTKEINSVQTRLMGYAGLTGTFNKTKVYNYVKNHKDYQAVQTLWDTLTRLNTELPKYQETKNQIDAQITKLKNDIEAKETEQKTIEGNIKELDEKFYKKYARFIQEGSWISEDYYDDNLYYLDAESVAYTSSRPQIQYNINVLRLSALDEFKNKIFNVGDKAYVEDTEFFGYLDDRITPYKEQVIISEITSVFDSPEQDTITVQNYKTQFEDLFQRITATTQSLQYASGAYNRAASIVEPTGEINSWTLEKSLAYNEQLAWRATDDSVVINATGITAVDTTNPQHMVRLSSAGLQVSNDGGITWTVGVSGAGISTQNLTAGSINVDNIQILSGTYPTFTWNKYGLSAYRFDTDSNGTISNVQSGNFVRHDQYGIYGVNNINDSDWKPYAVKGETPLEYIRKNAAFGMTWDGFFMRNKGYNYKIINNEEEYYYKIDENSYVKLNEDEPFQFNVQYYKFIDNPIDEEDQYEPLFILNPSKVYYVRDFKYITTKDNEPQEDKTYYIKEDNEYIEFEGQTFNSSLTYYERVEGEEFIQYSNDNVFSQDQTYYEKIFGNGYTEISSDGDIVVYDGQHNRIKIGNLGTIGDPKYGIQIKNGAGQDVMVTADDGSLWLKDRLNIGEEKSNYRIGIGNLGAAEGETLSQVFNANDNFIVYEDGSIKATNGKFSGDITGSTGTFSGTITAKDGNIGGFAIGENTLISKDNNLILQSQNYPDTYIQTFDEEKKQGKTYYKVVENEYVQFEGDSFEEGVVYYEKSGQTINANNNFIVYENGTIVVQNGIFSGEVNATSGTFAGDISAASGTLGGFKISKKIYYKKIINNIFETGIIYYELIDKYIETEDHTPIIDKVYYILEDGEYIEYIGTDQPFEVGVTYYEKTSEYIETSDEEPQEGKEYYVLREDDVLFSTNDINNPSIELNGTDGSIIANNIRLGTGAIIDQYIELGSAKIQNPEIEGNNRVFITAGGGALQIRDNGIANFGDITISGPQSIISGDNFAIRPGLSEFNNVNIKGTLQTSVFEVGTVQTVGGMMIFKEGAEIDGKITPLGNNQYTFKTKEGSITNIKEDSIILLTNKDDSSIRQYAVVKSINENNRIQTYVVEASSDIISCTNITQISDRDYGYFITSDTEKDNNKTYYIKDNNKYIEFIGESFEENVEYYERSETKKLKNNLLIGVNSNSSDQWQLLRQSFTMRQFEGLKSNIPENDESRDYGDWSEPLLVLGDLSGVADIKQESKIEGFGLYGENVYLTGSLTTEVAQNSYAGVNTLSKVMSAKFGNDDERIVFWAGASENSGEAIQKSPFQVTEKGSIYANSGLFEGAILTKVSISASKIYTADLYGWDTNSSSEEATAPLTIHAKYDGAPGINFVNDSNDLATTILSINNKGFIFKGEQFVNLESLKAKFIGEFETKNDSIKLNIAQTTISSISDDGNSTIYGTLVFEQAQNKLSIGDSNITQTNSNLGFNVPTTTISNELIIGTKLDYQKVNDGYDLYVS